MPRSLLPRFLRRLGVPMLGLAVSFAMNVQAALPEFPAIAPPEWVAQPLALNQRLSLYDFALSPDRQEIFVLARGLNAQQEDVMVIGVFDAHGKELRHQVLVKAEKDSNNRSELFFTDQAELIWNWNSKFFVWVDPKTLSVQAHPQCRVHAYPLEKEHRTQAKEEAQAWKLEQLQHINARFHLPSTPLDQETFRKQPNEYKEALRKLNDLTTAHVETLVEKRYLAVMKAAADKKPPSSGLEIDVGNGWPNEQYAKLEIEGQTWYCNIQKIAAQYPKTVWSKVAMQPDAYKHRPSVNSQGRATPLRIITDGDMQLLVHQRIRTSSYQEDLVGLIKTDEEMEWKRGTQSHRFLVKDRGLQVDRRLAFRLANGHVVVRYKGQLYLLKTSKTP